MKIKQIIESPITNLSTVGDFDDDTASMRFRSDRLWVTQDRNVKKIKKAWEKTPFNFSLFFVNVFGIDNHPIHTSPLGVVDRSVISSCLPIDATDQIISDSENGDIVVIYTNNEGIDRVPLTPWIIAHRLSHALLLTKDNVRDKEFVKAFYNLSENLSLKFCRTLQNANLYKEYFIDSKLLYDFKHMLFLYIGTMQSTRSKKLSSPYEFFHEIFAQYLLTGKVKFNYVDETFLMSIEKKLDFVRKPNTNNKFVLDAFNKELNELTEKIPHVFYNSLDSLKGKIIFM